jgi:EAL domain-containing protein (putative c-di-GMP-specific phosphodiesterase class I)
MAEGMNMQTTAEGVETVGQLQAVQVLGCDAVQGYLFCRPVQATALDQVIGAGAPLRRVTERETSDRRD